MPFLYILYDFFLLLLLLAWLPSLLISLVRSGKYKKSLKYRLGLWPPELRAEFGSHKWIWLHAVSVGEVGAVGPLVEALKQKHPQLKLLVSTVTETGNQLAKSYLKGADEIVYLPVDFRFISRRAIQRVKPALFIMAETEIWPNFLRVLAQQGIPALIINGRISAKSYRHYRWVKFFIRRVLADIDCFSMQSRLDAERIKALGALPERVQVTGNLKFDRLPPVVTPAQRQKLLASLGIESGAPIFIAGSTHPGEDEIILAAYKRLLADCPRLVLIIAPRHLERLSGIERLVKEQGLTPVRKSALAQQRAEGTVILLDTIGELAQLYSISSLVFVGGSLVPIGGHNILEPAAYGQPVLFGPHMDNFLHSAELLKEVGAGIEVQGVAQLVTEAQRLLNDRRLKDKLGAAAKTVVEQNQGATQRTLRIIEGYLGRPV
jgi:3-deoxy-D-manno-octulosonic-acid transferase